MHSHPSGGDPGRDDRTADRAELERFAALAESWWDANGPFKPLHKFNPTRLGYIRDRACAHFGRDSRAASPFAGLSVLDIGCGGGLVAEPMARLGARVTGIDALDRNLRAAALHADAVGLEIDYRDRSVEVLAADGQRFDLVLALEVIEHVAEPALFMAAAASLVKPGGALVAATLNRTLKAWALAIVGAEYVLGWLPRGTHDWRKFVPPARLIAWLRAGGLDVEDATGVSYNPLADRWSLSSDLGVNYMLFAVRPASPA